MGKELLLMAFLLAHHHSVCLWQKTKGFAGKQL